MNVPEDLHSIEWRDCPDSWGALNAQRRALQMADIVWTPIADVPHQRGVFEAGVPVTGLPYSSVREMDQFIGFEVSLHTFMTALSNPSSVLYTRDLRNPETPGHNPGNGNCATYYGVVCSTFAGYVLGMDMRCTTVHWEQIEGMRKVADNSAYGVKIGDTLCTAPGSEGHVIFVYGIVRTPGGRVKWVEIVESTKPCVRKIRYTPEEFNALIRDNNYVAYRYEGLKDISYEASPYVAVDGESTQPVPDNRVLGLDCGDRSNYSLGDTVSLHVMDASAVSLVIQQKNDANEWQPQAVIASHDIPQTIICDRTYAIYPFTPAAAAAYQAYCTLPDGTFSDAVQWQVASVQAQAPAQAATHQDIAVTFAGSSNAVPLYLSWNDDTGVTYRCQTLTETEIASGTALTRFDQPGTWYVKVYFVTAFGRLASRAQAVILSSGEVRAE